MSQDITLFEKNFGKHTAEKRIAQNNLCVIYTRVSSKDQEDNTSLETQKRYCIEYADRQKLIVVEFFGGKHESATTEERKEFQRMLSFVKKRKISNIVVYKVDRFSRSGAGGISLAEELKKRGHAIHSVTQPGDSFTPAGGLNQNLQFLFSHYENEVRKERCMNGVKEHLEKGFWMGTVPLGYTQVGFKKKQKFEINEKGMLIRKAFHWKAEGYTSISIIDRLKSLGLTMHPQHLSRIFRNPFYCGLIAHSALKGKIVEGNHPPLISREIFLKANEILSGNAKGYSHNKNEDHVKNIPLRRFIICDECGRPLTGYLVRRKNLYYYKCNNRHCKCNRSAKAMNEKFKELLGGYALDPRFIDPAKESLGLRIKELCKDRFQEQDLARKQLKEVNKKIEKIEERFVLGEIDEELYQKYVPKYREERDSIAEELGQGALNLSNLEKTVEKAISISSNLLETWDLADSTGKEKLQYLVFPDGIHYNRKNDDYRTTRVNSIFDLTSRISGSCKGIKKGISDLGSQKSPSVPKEGVEPSLPKEHEFESCASTNSATLASDYPV